MSEREGKPKVSVIVCCYNQKGLLPAALDSILAQKTDFKYEIVLADDCSQDGTRDVCRDYAARYPDIIRFVANKRNKGIVVNYYSAIEAARGEYIADLAGDDLWIDSDKLQRQADVLDTNPDTVLTHAAWRYLLPGGRLKFPDGFARPEREYNIDGKSLLNALLRHKKEEVFIHLCTALYRRDRVLMLMEKYPDIFRNPWPCEDFQLEVMLASVGRIHYDPKEVLAYRIGHPSLSSEEDTAKNARFAAGVLRLTILLADLLGKGRSHFREHWRKNFQYAVMNAFRSGYGEARGIVVRLDKDTGGWLRNPVSMLGLGLMKNDWIWKQSRAIWCKIRR